ncbi:MAG TPA: dienelactone hydrolase family protein [Candidatus Eisenbacteria bacterium]|nr:dienelactone hydrolase family protein [Candidatus Eisenbacteria bacterium]
MPGSWKTLKVDESEMPLYLSVPERGDPVAGIIVVHGQSGLESFIKETTHMLALQGYAAVAPNLYHRDGPDCSDDNATRKSRLRDGMIIKDIHATAGLLKRDLRVSRLGIVGFCMGGRIVYLMAAASRDFNAAVMFYGSSIMQPFGVGPSPFDRTREISCPLQGHFGSDDHNPSPDDMRKLDAELARWDKSHEFHTYPGAAHAFANAGSANYRPHAAALSWPKATAFFSRHLVEGHDRHGAQRPD